MIRSKTIAGVSLAALALGLAGAASGQQAPTQVLGGPGAYRQGLDQPARRTLAIPAGKSATIDFDRDLRMGGTTNPRVADVRVVTPRHVTILGVGYGQTDAQFYDASGRLVLTLDVRVEQDMKSIQESMARIVPGAQIEAHAINDGIVLTGVAKNAAEADRAVQVASMYAGRPEMVRNLLTITGKDQVTLKVQVVEVNRSVMKQLGFNTNFIMGQLGMPQWVVGNTPSYAVNGGFQGGAGLGYQVDTTKQPIANVLNEVSRVPFGNTGINTSNFTTFVDGFLRGDKALTAAQSDWVLTYLDGFKDTIEVTDQVTGFVYGGEALGINHSTIKALANDFVQTGGANLTGQQKVWFESFFGALPTYNTNYAIAPTSSFIDRTNPANAVGQDRAGSTGLNRGNAMIQAFERQGLVRTLAEPNLTAVSGEAAKFLAGGEYPVPTGRDQQGNISVEFKPYGVGLGFTPVVLSGGRISMKISTEVSELTTQGALTLAGIGGGNAVVIPALTVRRVEDTVELPSGGSMMIAGLLQEQTRQNIDKIPGLADMPVLGALARSRDFLNNETELVIIVTAYVTGPTSPDKLQTPADGLRIASDPETILFGKINSAYKAPPQAMEGRTYQGPIGHVIE